MSQQQLRLLLDLASPVLVASMAQALIYTGTTIFLGRLGGEELAGAGLALSYCNSTGVAVAMGLAVGIDVLCSQGHGAKQYQMIGVAAMRGTLISILFLFPLSLLWAKTGPMLRALGQRETVVAMAERFALTYLKTGCLFSWCVFENVKRALQAQEVVRPVVWTTLIGALANICYNCVAISILGLGVEGAAIALGATSWTMMVLLIWSVWWYQIGEKGSWDLIWSPLVLQEWWGYLSIAAPGVIGVCVEWWSFDGTMIVAGLLTEAELAGQTALLNIVFALYCVPLAIATACTIRVGNLLGENDPEGASQAAKVAILLSLGVAVAINIFLVGFISVWPWMYTNDLNVVAAIARVAWVLAPFELLDTAQVAASSIFKGMGRPHVPAVACFFAFWGIALPLSWWLSVSCNWGLRGIWAAFSVAELPLLIVYLVTLKLTNWSVMAHQARERVGASVSPKPRHKDLQPLLAAKKDSGMTHGTFSATT
ncbi:unnamed protein product [Chrysoparadoxa australica]